MQPNSFIFSSIQTILVADLLLYFYYHHHLTHSQSIIFNSGTGCPNKHGNEMTASISSLFQAGLFRIYDFGVSKLKHLTAKTTSLRISKMWSTNFFTYKVDGGNRKFVQIPVNLKSTKQV